MNGITLTALLAVTFSMPGARFQDGAQAVIQKIVASKSWTEHAEALEALRKLGDRKKDLIQRTAVRTADINVRRWCYKTLARDYANDRDVVMMLSVEGLFDTDEEIRFLCAFFMGTHKVYGAHKRLRGILKIPNLEKRICLAAQKSLAELGESDVILPLYHALGSDSYDERSMANLGIKTLSGKCLDDFEGYSHVEGTFRLSGLEFSIPIDGIRSAEKKAKRFQALTAYCRWLKTARPDLYKHLTADY